MTTLAPTFVVNTDQLLDVKKVSSAISESAIMKEAKSLYASKFEWIKNFYFVIFNGKTLRSCSEFRSFQRNYALSFHAISSLIDKLEVILRDYKIRIAVVDGSKLYKLTIESKPPTIDSLFECITNKLQLKLELYFQDHRTYHHLRHSVVIVQRAIRKWLYQQRRRKRKDTKNKIILVQCVCRGYLSRCRQKRTKTVLSTCFQDKWESNQTKLREWYSIASTSQNNVFNFDPTTDAAPETNTSHDDNRNDSDLSNQSNPPPPPSSSSSKTRNAGNQIIIYIPSASSSTTRNDYQEPCLLALQMLLHSNVKQLIYILSEPLSQAAESNINEYVQTYARNEYSDIRSKLMFIVSESYQLFHGNTQYLTYSPALLLYISVGTLKQLKTIITNATLNHDPSFPLLMTGDQSQPCLRHLCNYLDIPVFGGTPQLAAQLTRPLNSQKLFMSSKCRVLSLSQTEVHCESDLLIALAKVITYGIQDIETIVLSINSGSVKDHHRNNSNRSRVLFHVTRLSIYATLRKEYEVSLQQNTSTLAAVPITPPAVSVPATVLGSITHTRTLSASTVLMKNSPSNPNTLNPAASSSGGGWHSKSNQLNIRRRLIACLRKEISKCITFPSSLTTTTTANNNPTASSSLNWLKFLRLLSPPASASSSVKGGVTRMTTECVIEKELKHDNILGVISGLAFISPLGHINYLGGCDHILAAVSADQSTSTCAVPSVLRVGLTDRYSVGYVFEKKYTPTQALQGAMMSICSKLYSEHQVYGHVTVQFVSHYDDDNTPSSSTHFPRLSALRLHLGLSEEMLALGLISCSKITPLSTKSNTSLNKADMVRKTKQQLLTQSTSTTAPFYVGLSQSLQNNATMNGSGVYGVYLPCIRHDVLRSVRADRFQQAYRAKGLTFNRDTFSGTLYFSPYALCRDHVACLCVTSSRSSALNTALRAVNTICQLQYTSSSSSSSYSSNNSNPNTAANLPVATDANLLSFLLRKLIQREEEELQPVLKSWS